MITVLITADSRYPVSRPNIKKAIERTLTEKKVTSDVEVSVLICGTRKSRHLAQTYLHDDKPHNVLSFPLAERDHNGKIILGDIAVCYPIAQNEANTDDMRINDKVSELVQHGLLHLLGEHHE